MYLLSYATSLEFCSILTITTFLPTYLTPRNGILHEKLTVPQPVKKFPAFYVTPKVHYRIDDSSPPAPILSQINPVRAFPSHFLNINFNIILSSMPASSKWAPSLGSLHQNPICTFPHTCYMPCLCSSSSFDNPNDMG